MKGGRSLIFTGEVPFTDRYPFGRLTLLLGEGCDGDV